MVVHGVLMELFGRRWVEGVVVGCSRVVRCFRDTGVGNFLAVLVDAKAKALVTLLGLVSVVGSVTLWHEVFVIENPVAEGFAPTLLAFGGDLYAILEQVAIGPLLVCDSGGGQRQQAEQCEKSHDRSSLSPLGRFCLILLRCRKPKGAQLLPAP